MVPTVQMLSAAENLESNFSVNSVKSEILEKTKKNVVELT
jgi:phage tail tube protein FII